MGHKDLRVRAGDRHQCGTRIRHWLPWRGKMTIHLVGVDATLTVGYLSGRGIYATGLTYRQGRSEVRRILARPAWWKMKKVIVGLVSSPEGSAHLAPMESDALSKMHPLVAHAAVVKYDDGSTRTPGSWQVSTMGASWCVQVIDPDAKAFFRSIGQTLDEALILACLWLESGGAPWEPARWLHAKKK